MQRLNLKRRDPAESVQLLAGHYIRLLRWAEAEKPVFVTSFGNAGALYNQDGPRALQVSVKATF